MKNITIPGQITLWSMEPILKRRRPCEYSFQRYIGQKVRDHNGIHTISGINGYYTYFEDGTIGTPTMSPVDKYELLESIKVDLEYYRHVDKTDHTRDRTSGNIANRNVLILEKRMEDLENELSGNTNI